MSESLQEQLKAAMERTKANMHNTSKSDLSKFTVPEGQPTKFEQLVSESSMTFSNEPVIVLSQEQTERLIFGTPDEHIAEKDVIDVDSDEYSVDSEVENIDPVSTAFEDTLFDGEVPLLDFSNEPAASPVNPADVIHTLDAPLKIEVPYDNGTSEIVEIDPDSLISFLQKKEDADAEVDKQQSTRLAVIMDELADIMVDRYGLTHVSDADMLHLLSERAMLNETLKEFFHELGFNLDFRNLLPARGVRTAYGTKLLSPTMLQQNMALAITEYRMAKEEKEKALNKLADYERTIQAEMREINQDKIKTQAYLDAAKTKEAHIRHEIETFNLKTMDRPYILFGRYTVKVAQRFTAKAKNGIDPMKRTRTTFIGVNKTADQASDGLYATKDLFCTPRIEEALRFETPEIGDRYLSRIFKKMQTGKLTKEQGITPTRFAALYVAKITIEAHTGRTPKHK